MSCQDVAEEILKRRPLYLVTVVRIEAFCTATFVIGLYFSERAAVLAGLRDLFLYLHFDHYDPGKRFFLYNEFTDGPRCWKDQWNDQAGHDDFKIDEMYPGECGRAWRKTFQFDEIVKDMVIRDRTSSQGLRNVLRRWRTDVLSSDIIPAALENIATANRPLYRRYEGERQAWVAQYGSAIPYPYGGPSTNVDEL